MQLHNWLLIFVSLDVSLTVSFLTPEQELHLDSIVSANIQNISKVPGFGVAIVRVENDLEGSAFLKGYGLMDVELQRPVDSTTRLLIASISKSFTATVTCNFLAGRYPQYGESILDIPIIQLDPHYGLIFSDRFRTEHTTFRDLLSHRTCLNSYGLGVTAGAYATREERVYRFRYLEEKCGFRSRFEYSNNMLILAGDIVSHLSGVPFDDMVYNFMDQLGMHDSLIMDNVTDYEVLPNMSRGYYMEPDQVIRKMNATLYNGNSGAAAGGIISTIQDMGRYLQFHLSDGFLGGVQIVPKHIMEWLRTSSNYVEPSEHRTSMTSDNSDTVFAYGLGLELGAYRGWQRISHDGDLSPFTSQLTLFPSKKLGVFTFSNGPGPLEPQYGHNFIRNEVFDMLFNLESRRQTADIVKRKNMRKESNACQSHSVEIKKAPDSLAGLYGHPYEGVFTVEYDENNSTHPLRIQYGHRGSGYLLETSNTNVYRIEWFGVIVSQLYAYSGGKPLGDMNLDFNTPDTATYIDSDGSIEYKRNATLDTLPVIPWDPTSCGPNL